MPRKILISPVIDKPPKFSLFFITSTGSSFIASNIYSLVFCLAGNYKPQLEIIVKLCYGLFATPVEVTKKVDEIL